jgi:hypothetical protein
MVTSPGANRHELRARFVSGHAERRQEHQPGSDVDPQALLRWSRDDVVRPVCDGVRSDHLGELIEGFRQTKPFVAGVNTEFVVAASWVLTGEL